jgi:hypothetical protein
MRLIALLMFAGLAAPVALAEEPDRAEREQALLEQVRRHDECRYEKLLELQDQNPRAFHRALEEVARHFSEMRLDPRAQQLEADAKAIEAQIRARVLALRNVDGDKAARKIEKELDELAGELFDLRSQAQTARIERMKTRLDTLEADLADREANRDEFIEGWLGELIAEP